MYPPTITIEAPTLAIAWQKLVKEVMRDGVILPTEYGPKSKDVCSVTTVTFPYAEPALHPSFPTKEDHLIAYCKQFDRDFDWEKQGFKYTYMDRFINYPYPHVNAINEDIVLYESFLDQFEEMKLQLLQKTTTRRAQIITWIPEIDQTNDEPPCLQRIWMRKLNDTNVEMHCDWRSRDLFCAWNSNYIAILYMIKKEILDPLGLKMVKLVDFCDSLHIYEGNWEEAEKINVIAASPMLTR